MSKILRAPKRLTIRFFSYFLITSFLVLSCQKDQDEIPDCGCDSTIRTTIPESANLIGKIAYKKQLDPNDNYYNNKFWIAYTEQNCSNCVHKMIVCNEGILNQQILNLKSNGQTLNIKFSGHLKEICEKTFDIADVTYENIILTKIIVQ
ncbi:hypothetical protein [Flavobacterium granuli]|uniref:Lipoprotein n=1 Tax=Flavobacterium granuli TaxID=280093 RepID=A0A1M5LPE1_9FLAO|nr:hypothetical protein [Flavobacterium granuli]PRZ24053.1 hypothetical protein BC624_104168 [Flavobacterium granuli]SHG66826.1 hypothetical protein SAMN05443373_103168 [Flavobacterium granuli]